MTKTTELAKDYAQANYNEWVGDNYWQVENDYEDIKDAYRNGAEDMLERVCKWLEMNTNWTNKWDDFGMNMNFGKIDELRKDMEE